MYWIDSYADKYQKINGFEAFVNTLEGPKKAWLSMKPTTRAAYDLSMRENSIDGLITMDNISDLKSGYTYYTKQDPDSLYFIQTLSKWETQPKSKNFNALKCNCKVTVQRKGFVKDEPEEQWIDIYKDVPASMSDTLADSKNFNAGFEVNTIKTIQMPMWEFVDEIVEKEESDEEIEDIEPDEELDTEIEEDLETLPDLEDSEELNEEEEIEEVEVRRVEKARIVKENDKVIVTSNISDDLVCEIHVESVDNFGISGTVKFQGTQDMRIV